MTSYIDTWMMNATTMIAVPLMAAVMLFLVAKGPQVAFRIQSARYNSGVKNILLMLLNGWMIGLIVAGVGFVSQLIFSKGLPHVDGDIWTGVPVFWVVLFTVVAFDFTNYWNHRVMHSRFLWGIHAIHHSDADINWTTSYRIHVFEWVIMSLGFLLIMGWMSLPAWALGAAGFIHGAYNKYVHCQLGWTHGRLSKWVISPNYHRWHHADNPDAYDKNFGDMFAVWDRMFGTFYDGGICEAKLGFPEGPMELPAMLIYPFRYWKQEFFAKPPRDILELSSTQIIR